MPTSDANLHYLRGAEAAEARDYDTAVAEWRLAIELNPDLHTARFQLGLLHLTMKHPDLAMSTWAPLESQPDDSLRLFKRGLESLICDDFTNCIQQLQAGIRTNHTNAPLNGDMQLLIDKVREHLEHGASPRDDSPPRTDFSLYEH